MVETNIGRYGYGHVTKTKYQLTLYIIKYYFSIAIKTAFGRYSYENVSIMEDLFL